MVRCWLAVVGGLLLGAGAAAQGRVVPGSVALFEDDAEGLLKLLVNPGDAAGAWPVCLKTSRANARERAWVRMMVVRTTRPQGRA